MCGVTGCTDAQADRLGCAYDNQAACDSDQRCAWLGQASGCKPCNCAGCPAPSCDDADVMAEGAAWEVACAAEYELLKTNPALASSVVKPLSDSGLGGNPYNAPPP